MAAVLKKTNDLKEYTNMPTVEINGKKFVDENILLNILDRKILEERKHCLSEEERNGIDICRNIIANWR